MDDHTMGRRRLLKGAGAAAGGAVVGGLTTASPAQADNDHHGGRAVGSWLATRFDPADGVERTFTLNLGRGGVASMVDISPVFITGQGPWTSRGRKVLTMMVIGVPEADGAPALTFRVYIEGRVRGDELAGTFTYDVFLADLTTQVGEGEGTWSATRLSA